MTQDEFAKAIGARSRQALIPWEKHGRFPRDYIEGLRKMGVPERFLVSDDEWEQETLRRLAELEATAVRVEHVDRLLSPLREAILALANGNIQEARRLLSELDES